MIYVDSPTTYPWVQLRYKTFSHMWSDTADVDEHGDFRDDELHAMAARIGLKREWYQLRVGPNATFAAMARKSHYDVTPPKRLLALRYGATAMEVREFLETRALATGQEMTG